MEIALRFIYPLPRHDALITKTQAFEVSDCCSVFRTRSMIQRLQDIDTRHCSSHYLQSLRTFRYCLSFGSRGTQLVDGHACTRENSEALPQSIESCAPQLAMMPGWDIFLLFPISSPRICGLLRISLVAGLLPQPRITKDRPKRRFHQLHQSVV